MSNTARDQLERNRNAIQHRLTRICEQWANDIRLMKAEGREIGRCESFLHFLKQIQLQLDGDGELIDAYRDELFNSRIRAGEEPTDEYM